MKIRAKLTQFAWCKIFISFDINVLVDPPIVQYHIKLIA